METYVYHVVKLDVHMRCKIEMLLMQLLMKIITIVMPNTYVCRQHTKNQMCTHNNFDQQLKM